MRSHRGWCEQSEWTRQGCQNKHCPMCDLCWTFLPALPQTSKLPLPTFNFISQSDELWSCSSNVWFLASDRSSSEKLHITRSLLQIHFSKLKSHSSWVVLTPFYVILVRTSLSARRQTSNMPSSTFHLKHRNDNVRDFAVNVLILASYQTSLGKLCTTTSLLQIYFI